MKQRARIYYTAKQKAVMWDRWKKGKNHYKKYLNSIHSYLLCWRQHSAWEQNSTLSSIQLLRYLWDG